MSLFDPTPCQLGEGALWHPLRGQLFWVDILGCRLHSRVNGQTLAWQFDEHVSAAGWVDERTLLVASETRLFTFDLETGTRRDIAPLEADKPGNRSNDGRADPFGGFWIGTMGKAAEPGAGAIYRYYRGEVRCLVPSLTISNAICFSPDHRHAYFCDTNEGVIQRWALGPEGWPDGAPEPFIDLRAEGVRPDGAVVDATGHLWNAQWGAHRVACYSPQGDFVQAVAFAAAHTSCPAFGGPDLTTLFCTSARQGLSPQTLEQTPENGATFAAGGFGPGQREHQVIL